MTKSKQLLSQLNSEIPVNRASKIVSFDFVLDDFADNPRILARNIGQYYLDTVNYYVREEESEYPGDPEFIGHKGYFMDDLFVNDKGIYFFADRLFQNRYMKFAKKLGNNIAQSTINRLVGLHGCGKSTCFNHFFERMEAYSETDLGRRYEVVWMLDGEVLGDSESYHVEKRLVNRGKKKLEIVCPNHCNPLLLIPIEKRKDLFTSLVGDTGDWKTILKSREYRWLFTDEPCGMCSDISKTIVKATGKVSAVYEMLFAQRYIMDVKNGYGIMIYNPADSMKSDHVVKNKRAQEILDKWLGSSGKINLSYSMYSRSNNGIFVIMDLKGKNRERHLALHNVVSEGYFRNGWQQEKADMLFFVVANPEDDVEDVTPSSYFDNSDEVKEQRYDLSLTDRTEDILCNYVLVYQTEVKILKQTLGKAIEKRFLPRVLDNFAKIVIASRMNEGSNALNQWIYDSSVYETHCDRDLLLLKMDIYAGIIPDWLTESDKIDFTKKIREALIEESEYEGQGGISGRDSPRYLTALLQEYREDTMISMDMMYKFFTKKNGDFSQHIPDMFLESLVNLYDYSILNEVKDAMFRYNLETIDRNIKNYLFAICFDIGETVLCEHTGDIVDVTEDFYDSIEVMIYGDQIRFASIVTKRNKYQHRYVQEKKMGVPLEEMNVYKHLRKLYLKSLNKNTLIPLLTNSNYRKALLVFGEEEFKTYDQKVQVDINHVLMRLIKNYGYREKGAIKICLDVIDKDLPSQFDKRYF